MRGRAAADRRADARQSRPRARSVGEAVRARQPVVVVEAMKMENELRAGRDGTVAEIHTQEGRRSTPAPCWSSIAPVRTASLRAPRAARRVGPASIRMLFNWSGYPALRLLPDGGRGDSRRRDREHADDRHGARRARLRGARGLEALEAADPHRTALDARPQRALRHRGLLDRRAPAERSPVLLREAARADARLGGPRSTRRSPSTPSR